MAHGYKKVRIQGSFSLYLRFITFNLKETPSADYPPEELYGENSGRD